MTARERVKAILTYQSYDRLPIVHFGFWRETLAKWATEGHITEEEAKTWSDGNTADASISRKLGFDGNWSRCFSPAQHLFPFFEKRVVTEFPDGSRHELNPEGVVELVVPGAVSIRSEIQHTLTDRASWEEHYKWRLQWSEDRVRTANVLCGMEWKKWDEGGLDYLRKGEWDEPTGLFCGSMYGNFRNIIGVEGSSYLYMDDEALYDEILDTYCETIYRNTEYVLKAGAKFDFVHMWEDICFKNGPLVAPSVFAEKVGPHYKRLTDLLRQYGIDIVSLDCDGWIDALIPTWLENGVNTMFPMEVGTWNASIKPWREKFGKSLRGVGGMNKVIFGYDRAAVDAEVERLRPLVELGGYIPCPDHRIAPEAKWDLVKYYCERMRAAFE